MALLQMFWIYINNNPLITTVFAGLILAGALALIRFSMSNGQIAENREVAVAKFLGTATDTWTLIFQFSIPPQCRVVYDQKP